MWQLSWFWKEGSKLEWIHVNTLLFYRNGGAAGIAVTVEGPSDANVSCTESKDGRYHVQYTPSVPGLYEVNITQGGEHIAGTIRLLF